MSCISEELKDLNQAIRDSNSYLREMLDDNVQTIEVEIDERGSAQLIPGNTTQTFTIVPQTSGMEVIEGVFAEIVPRDATAIPGYPLSLETFTVQLGTIIIDMLALTPRLVSPVKWKIESRDVRTITVNSASGFPVGFNMEYYLWGHAVPLLQGGKLH